MKRLISISLLVLFLYNVVGYYLVFWGLHYQAGREMNRRLEAEDYVSAETITFKVPFPLPYHTHKNDYERVTGEFEHHGEFFKLIKQKLENDTLTVVCIKDHKEKQILSAMTDFAKLSNDLPASSQKTLQLLGGFIKDFVSGAPVFTQSCDGWKLTITFVSGRFTLLANDLPVLSPPPDRLA